MTNYTPGKRELDYGLQTNFYNIKFDNEDDKQLALQGIKNCYKNIINNLKTTTTRDVFVSYIDKNERFVLRFMNRNISFDPIELCLEFEEKFLSTTNRPDLFTRSLQILL